MPRRQPPIRSLEQFASRLAPDLEIVSISRPEPSFRAHNVIGITEDESVAREAVVSLESESASDAKIGVVVLSSTASDATDSEVKRVDPERVTRFVGKRVLIGGLIGAAVGALLIGGVVAIITGGSGPVIAAAFGGALFMAVPGATYTAFAGLGGSSAYRQTWVPPDIADVALVSLHTDNPMTAASARERLAEADLLALVEIDSAGREVR